MMSERIAHRIVIKIGSSTLTDEQGRLDEPFVDDLARQVAAVRARGSQALIVTSAAITAGLDVLGLGPRPSENIPSLQAAAAVGQLALTRSYASAFERRGITIGQILLTRYGIENREAYLHARDTLERLLELGVVPLINENDSVAIDEIRFGDNDTLAAQVAILVKADLVVLLSDIRGLYTADPRLDEDALLLEEIAAFTEEIVKAAGEAGTARGSGGMATKIEAARMLMAADIPMVICEGHRSDALIDAASGKSVGTLFAQEGARHQTTARKLWLALSGTVRGTVFIDDGAVRALREQGSSLLAVGVARVEGDFVPRSVLDIRTLDGFLIGRGLSGYSSTELVHAAGRKMSEIADDELLAHRADCEVIHRDELVIF
ncbi:MAG: glutamate 5-kinase [Coriobacteriales bacterium]|jgi:glutamate 5-kinase|nr:glutamate 5-kinase [Coriobacteriales bacterium]